VEIRNPPIKKRKKADLEHNFLHFLVGRDKLADQNQHHLLGVVGCVLGVHQRNQIADGFEKGGEAFAAVGANTLKNFPILYFVYQYFNQ
jgi:hypothetical protein